MFASRNEVIIVKRVIAVILCAALLLGLFPISALGATKTYTGTVNTDKVFFRIKASTSGGYYCKLSKNTKVTVSGITGDYYKVTYNKKNGYIQTKYINLSSSAKKALEKTKETTAKTDPKMEGITKISQITVPSTTKKGNSGKSVTALQQALKLKGYYKNAIDGSYGNSTVEAVKAF